MTTIDQKRPSASDRTGAGTASLENPVAVPANAPQTPSLSMASGAELPRRLAGGQPGTRRSSLGDLQRLVDGQPASDYSAAYPEGEGGVLRRSGRALPHGSTMEPIEGNDLAAGNVHQIGPQGEAPPPADFARDFRSQFSNFQYSQPSGGKKPPKPTNWSTQKLVALDSELRANNYVFVGYMGAGTNDASRRVRDGFPAMPENMEDSWEGRYMSTSPETAAGYAVDDDGNVGVVMRAYAPRDLVEDRFYRTSEPLNRGNPSHYFGDGRGLGGRSLTGPQSPELPEPETVMDHSITGNLIMIPSQLEVSPDSYSIVNPDAERDIVGLNSAPPEYQELTTSEPQERHATTTEPPGESWNQNMGLLLPFLFIKGAKGDPRGQPEGYDSAAKASAASYETQSRFFQYGDPIDGNPYHRRYTFPNNGGHVDIQAYEAQGEGQGFTSQFFDGDKQPVGGYSAVQNFWGQKSGDDTSWSTWRSGTGLELTQGRITRSDGGSADPSAAGLLNVAKAVQRVQKIRDETNYTDWKQWASSGAWDGYNGLISWGSYLSNNNMAVKFKDDSFAVGINGNWIKDVVGDDWVTDAGGGADWSGYSGQLLVDKNGQPTVLQLSHPKWADFHSGYTFVYQYDPARPEQKRWLYQPTDTAFLETFEGTTVNPTDSGVRLQIPSMGFYGVEPP